MSPSAGVELFRLAAPDILDLVPAPRTWANELLGPFSFMESDASGSSTDFRPRPGVRHVEGRLRAPAEKRKRGWRFLVLMRLSLVAC